MACYEDMKNFTAEHWTPVATFCELLEQPAGAYLCYTRNSYLSPAEYKKLSESGSAVTPRRKRITCIVKEVDHEQGFLHVQSTPRKFKDSHRELKTLSWKLQEGMKGDVKYYIAVPKSQEEIHALREKKRRRGNKKEATFTE